MAKVMELLSLQGKTALVTGANRGIGEGLAIALAEAGADVVIMVRDKQSGDETVKQLRSLGVQSEMFLGDVTVKEDIDKVLGDMLNMFPCIDILVNNAGICRNSKAEEMSWCDWYDVINVNLNSVFLMCQVVGKQMIKQNHGSIINISSVSAKIVNHPQPQCSYNAAKAGVSQLTKSLAYEWARYNIRVNAIAPGYIETDMTKPGLENWGKIWLSMVPMKRMAQPSELGGLTVYLASDASSYTTGGVFIVDGGYTLV